MDYQNNIDLIFNDGLKREALLILNGAYAGKNNSKELSELSGSGTFLLSELERTGYIQKNNGHLNLTNKGKDYVENIKRMPKQEVIVLNLKEEKKELKLEALVCI